LPSDQPVYGIHVHCTEGQIGHTLSVPSLAQESLDRIRAIQPAGRVTIAGHSAGGLIALEAARKLLDANEPQPRVLLIDTVRPSGTFGYYWAELLLNLPELRDASTGECIGQLRAAWRRRRDQRGFVENDDLVGLAERDEVSTNNLIRHYRAQAYRGAITVMRTRQGRLMAFGRHDLGWTPVTKGVLSLIDIPGTHIGAVEPPHVQSLAEKVNGWLYSE
jgi:aspartate racemase